MGFKAVIVICQGRKEITQEGREKGRKEGRMDKRVKG